MASVSPIRPRVAVSELGADSELLGAVAMGLAIAQERLFQRAETKGAIAV
jgi:hypothetical protein